MEILLYKMLIWEGKMSFVLQAFSQETVLEEKMHMPALEVDLKKNVDVQHYSWSDCTKYKTQPYCDIEKIYS